MYSRLVLNSWNSWFSCLHLPNAHIISIYHHIHKYQFQTLGLQTLFKWQARGTGVASLQIMWLFYTSLVCGGWGRGVLEESWQIWALPHTHTKFISPSSYAKHIHMCDVGLPVDGVCFTATAPHNPGSLLPKAKGIGFKMSFWNLGLFCFSYLKIFCFLFISSVFTF